MLNVGDRAPDFELLDQNGTIVSLDALLTDGDLILYFYPIDFSPVCTAQACAFRGRYADIRETTMQVVGVSPQNPETHRTFAKQFDLPFPLLSDPRKRAIRAYGVDGLFGFGVRRATYLIDQTKTIRARVVSDLLVGSHTDLIERTIDARARGATPADTH